MRGEGSFQEQEDASQELSVRKRFHTDSSLTRVAFAPYPAPDSQAHRTNRYSLQKGSEKSVAASQNNENKLMLPFVMPFNCCNIVMPSLINIAANKHYQMRSTNKADGSKIRFRRQLLINIIKDYIDMTQSF